MTNIDIRDRILDAAEARARRGGYNGFSYRDLAEDVGIKSSSVHYHYPSKPLLAEALMQRYTQRAQERLGVASDVSAEEAVDRVTAMFRDALVQDDRMCLCGLFGAQRDELPPEVAAAVAGFFQYILDYLRTALAGETAFGTPESLLAKLEGALILARSLRSADTFEAAIGWRPARA
ncbi:TetR/AcrR family transcriptional regulator [Asticcacaulis sp. W401b]|uniref:TetR/AcrR family transcriptional regulator n=1 Tax=Asticcacaulis sp. W401b TaxID=3388666 RepID=UPI0039704C49